MKRLPRWMRIALAAALVAGCGGEEEIEPAEEAGAMDGLTPEQIRAEAEPMSPVVAESLGIVDTTIHIESPVPEGVVGPEGTPLPFADTAGIP